MASRSLWVDLMMEMQEDDCGIDQLENNDYVQILGLLQQAIFSVPIISEKDIGANPCENDFIEISEELREIEQKENQSLQ